MSAQYVTRSASISFTFGCGRGRQVKRMGEAGNYENGDRVESILKNKERETHSTLSDRGPTEDHEHEQKYSACAPRLAACPPHACFPTRSSPDMVRCVLGPAWLDGSASSASSWRGWLSLAAQIEFSRPGASFEISKAASPVTLVWAAPALGGGQQQMIKHRIPAFSCMRK
jgi:hypothetical protein